jgi:hypothetical protein
MEKVAIAIRVTWVSSTRAARIRSYVFNTACQLTKTSLAGWWPRPEPPRETVFRPGLIPELCAPSNHSAISKPEGVPIFWAGQL